MSARPASASSGRSFAESAERFMSAGVAGRRPPRYSAPRRRNVGTS